jgi:hypothetical protein
MASKNEKEGSTGESQEPEGPSIAEVYADSKKPRAQPDRPSHKIAGPLGDSPALETLSLAAKAVGLTTEQLVNLVVDSGAMALPPPDGATEQLTLTELGAHLRAQLSQQPRLLRPEWFRKLSKVQRGAVVVALRTHGASTHAIAMEFNVPAVEVNDVYNAHVDKIGQNVTNVRLTMIVGQMQIIAERAQQGAMEKNDWSTYWRIQKDLIGQLQSLGVVDKAIHRVEVMHSLGDREKENIEQLAQLRAKQLARRKEIKLVTAGVTDSVPEEFTTDDETTD